MGTGKILIATVVPFGGVLAALVLGAGVATRAFAEETGVDPSGLQLEEVVVSARRRTESLQETPVSVSAFSAAELAARQASTIADVGRFTPNVSFDAGAALSGGSNAVTVFIRGVGQTDFNLTIDPGVGLYLDGVYIGRSIGALLDTADLEQVQILRGPQGTLFGKNTIGGAVLMTSRRPAKEWGFSADVSTGRYDRLDVKATLNAPLSEGVRSRLSVARFSRDGYVQRLSDGQHMGNRDALSGRGSLEIDMGDQVTVALDVDGMRAREEAPGTKLLALDENGLFAVAHNIFQNGATCAPGVPGRQSNPQCYTSQWLTNSQFSTWASDRNRSDTDVWGAALTATWHAPWGQMKSITAYRDLKSTSFLEADGSPLNIANTGNNYRQNQLSQELQFNGEALDGRLYWLLGLYYLRERGTDVNELQWSIGGGISGGRVDNDSAAAFSQLTYRINDRISVTGGLRYTDETKRFLPNQYLTAFDPTVSAILFGVSLTDLQGGPLSAGDRLLPPIEGRTTANELTPALTVDYHFDDDVFGYATYSKGFKSGGFTQRVFPPLPAAPSFKPEFVDNYEIGLKSEWFNRRLRLNAALFYMNYTDLQITVTRFVAPTIENAGKARSRGVELEVETRINERLRVSGGLGYTDATYRNVPPNAAPVTVHSRLPNAPRVTGSLSATADLLHTSSGNLQLNADWSYKGEHFKDAANSPALRQGGYGLLSASVGWRSADQRWSLTGGATNLTDRKYLVTGNADLSGGGYVYGIVGRPREWFVTAGFRVE